MLLFTCSICAPCLLLCFILFLLRKSLCLVTVIGASMTPLLVPGDRVLVLRWYPLYLLRQGQVVVLTTSRTSRRSGPGHATWYVKRIVALAGDTFTQNTPPYDAELDEHSHKHVCVDEANRWSWHIPPGHIFVCGDNRQESIDSRLWGPLPIHQIIGIVLTKLPGSPVTLPEAPSRDFLTHEPLPIGQPAPAWSAETLNGEIMVSEQFHGNALLLVFLAHNDLSYRKIPSFLKLAEELAIHHIAVVFVFDGTREIAHRLRERLPTSQQVLCAPRKHHAFFQEYCILGTPAYCLLDDQHLVRATGFSRLDTATVLTHLERRPSALVQEESNA